jgi:hypothetical protein
VLPWIAALFLLGWLVARFTPYTPGSPLGYNLGLIGGLMMLALLLYPLRKHIGLMRYLGPIKHWFRLHMLFGVVGPLLIIFHSTFTIGSLNAGVAMACMLLVAGSGIIGRFIYARIHHGLYGQKATLQELQARLGLCEGEVRSKFHFAPRVGQQLVAFGESAQQPSHDLGQATARMAVLAVRAFGVHRRCMRDVRRALREHASQRGWPRAKLHRQMTLASGMIRRYLDVARSTAQFGVYERLFALWHILHVPFVFMLAISGVVHVIAVHMY